MGWEVCYGGMAPTTWANGREIGQMDSVLKLIQTARTIKGRLKTTSEMGTIQSERWM